MARRACLVRMADTPAAACARQILFSLDPGSACPELQRNEVIALINLLHRLSESVKTNREFGAAWRSGAVGPVLELQASHPALPTFLGF